MAVTTPNNEFLDGLFGSLLDQVRQMAPQLQSDEDAKDLNADEISMLWNERAMPVEKEWDLWRARNPDGTPLYTPEQIGLMVFPKRERLAKSGGRIEPKAQISWANQQAKREQAKREQMAPPLEPAPMQPAPMTTTPPAPPTEAGLSLPGGM